MFKIVEKYATTGSIEAGKIAKMEGRRFNLSFNPPHVDPIVKLLDPPSLLKIYIQFILTNECMHRYID